jgi:hypothetical protein
VVLGGTGGARVGCLVGFCSFESREVQGGAGGARVGCLVGFCS